MYTSNTTRDIVSIFISTEYFDRVPGMNNLYYFEITDNVSYDCVITSVLKYRH